MALIVEDGTGLSNAESYSSVARATAYHAAMGNTAWAAATESAHEIALRRGTQFLDTEFRYRGTRRTTTQAREWPRVDYEDRYRVEAWPVEPLLDACCEAALRALPGALRQDASTDQVTEETVGPITIKYASKSGQTRYPVITALLQRYIISGGGILRVERGS